jgi:hypothetical protein
MLRAAKKSSPPSLAELTVDARHRYIQRRGAAKTAPANQTQICGFFKPWRTSGGG